MCKKRQDRPSWRDLLGLFLLALFFVVLIGFLCILALYAPVG